MALLSLVNLGAAIGLWYLLHFIAYWLTLLFLTAVKGTDTPVPGAFHDLFWLAAAALLAIAWINRRFRPDDRARDDQPAGEIMLDLVLAVPRVTLAVWGTLSAWQRLDPSELAQAAALIDRLAQERRLNLQSIPVEIPNSATRFKILLALQLVQVIDVRREDREFWVSLNPLTGRSAFPSALG